MEKKLAGILARVREQTPLIHHITNLVVTNVTANVTLAVGASPVMAHAREEVADMVKAAGALVLNIGTLSPELVEAMVTAGKKANESGIPVILDPVGAGATPLRTESAEKIFNEVKVDILRGNAAEISVIGGFGGEIRGVDAVDAYNDRATLAKVTARSRGCVVAVTGPEDYVSDGERMVVIENGDVMLSKVTGTGCSVTSVVAAFAAVEEDKVLACAGAIGYYGFAAQLAAEKSSGPGSFQPKLLDWLYNMDEELLMKGLRIKFRKI